MKVNILSILSIFFIFSIFLSSVLARDCQIAWATGNDGTIIELFKNKYTNISNILTDSKELVGDFTIRYAAFGRLISSAYLNENWTFGGKINFYYSL